MLIWWIKVFLLIQESNLDPASDCKRSSQNIDFLVNFILMSFNEIVIDIPKK